MLVLLAAFVLLVVALSVVRLIVSIFAPLLVWVLLLMKARVTLIVGIAVIIIPLVLKLVVLPFFIIVRSGVSLLTIEVRI